MQKLKKNDSGTQPASFEQLVPFIDEQLRTLSASINTLLTMVPAAEQAADSQNYEVIGVSTNREDGSVDFTTEKVSDLSKSTLLRKGLNAGAKVSILHKSLQNQPVSLIELSQLFQRQLDSITATFNTLVDMTQDGQQFSDGSTDYEVVVSRIENGQRIYTNAEASTLKKSNKTMDRATSVRLAKTLKRAMLK